jgi:class 3 adenylate cyclase
MDEKGRSPNELLIESIKISYTDNEGGRTAKCIHNELYEQLHLKTTPPSKIPTTIAQLGMSEILITIILTSIAKDIYDAVLNYLRAASEAQVLKAGEVHIKFDHNDPGRRFRFHKETGWEKFLKIIQKYINQRYKRKGETLVDLIEDRVRIDDRIVKLFEREATFLDIDVVSSAKLRKAERDLAISAYSFEQYYKFVKKKVGESNGKVLDAIGDEVMAWFDTANDAVDCALRIFKSRDEFNRTRNRLENPFQFRIGINTGKALIDVRRGKAFSRGVLDLAGHLQKASDRGSFLISKSTYEKVEDKARFLKSKFLENDKQWGYIIIDEE